MKHDEPGFHTWMGRGSCLEYDPDMWFPKRGDWHAAQKAINICDTCPVRKQCLDYALQSGQEQGIWGGVGISQHRRRLNRETA